VRRPALLLIVPVVLLAAACSDDDEGAATTTAAPTTATTTATTTPPAEPALDPLGGFDPAPLAWEACGAGTECASLTVPLDWSDPAGATIDLLVARVPAGDADGRAGALVTNPGGPGASGVDFLRGSNPFAGTELAARFDVVSWDPRGVGGSAPLRCDGAPVESFLRLDSDPDDAGEQAALDAAARSFAESCGRSDAALLGNVGTDDVARDLEALRRAMGVPMAYHGFSYGTLIGLRYAELFPMGATGIVLDGVVDPTEGLTDLLRNQAAAFDGVLTEALGDRLDGWDELAARVEQAPVPTADGRGLGPADLQTGTFLAGYDESYRSILRRGVDEALAGDGSTLLELADSYRDFGSFPAYEAVSCTDSEHPVGGEAWARFAAELEAVSPRFGAGIANEMLPCAFWPVPPEPIVGPVRAEGAPPILVIGTSGDPATPLAQAEQVAAMLADGRLLVHEGEGHTAYGTNACVDGVVERYLLDGELPEPGARC